MENKQFFDPYNFNNVPMQPIMQQNTSNDDASFPAMVQVSPTMFYEQQYWYYKYLTKMLEYKIKLKEYENLTNKK